MKAEEVYEQTIDCDNGEFHHADCKRPEFPAGHIAAALTLAQQEARAERDAAWRAALRQAHGRFPCAPLCKPCSPLRALLEGTAGGVCEVCGRPWWTEETPTETPEVQHCASGPKYRDSVCYRVGYERLLAERPLALARAHAEGLEAAARSLDGMEAPSWWFWGDAIIEAKRRIRSLIPAAPEVIK